MVEHDLTRPEIENEVESGRMGTYELGQLKLGSGFNVEYVGRSENLKFRLKQQAGEYHKFRFSYASNKKEAFEEECRLYHKHGPGLLDNEQHPERPNQTNVGCPVKGCDALE